ncbi:unnamed protein product [Paramecium primaurelia]|uniref:Uncharacterized protein n=1 Tax=Paramecium primaurelia TaxID=5886 RepID=A0A8S1PRF8_PARPR|nr:unnamed protein product [Paramecium primaurelia]
MNQSGFEKPHVLQSISDADKLQFYNSTRLWHTKFNYQLFDTEELKSVHFEDNKKFIMILKSIQNFNKEIQQSQKQSRFVPTMPTRYNFYQNIVNLLREAAIAKGRDAQLIFLDKVYGFFLQNNREAMKTQDKETGNTSSSEDSRFIIQDQSQPLPSQQINDQLKDYKDKKRTIHKNCDPPQLRLKLYKRRQFNQMNNMIPQLQIRSTFPKVVSIPQKEQDENLQQSQEQTEGEIVIDGDLLGNDDDEEKKKIIVNMVPKIKVFQKDDVNLEFKDLNQQFEIRQNYQLYQPSNQEIELNLQNRWIQFRQKEAAEKKMDEEIVNSMNIWSKNKARIEKEIDRRIDSQYYGSRYAEIDKRRSQSVGLSYQSDPKVVNLKPLPTIIQSQNRQYDSVIDVSFLESKASAQRVLNARRAYKDILNLSANDVQPDEQPSSLSIYANKLRSNSLHNKFSQLLQRNSPTRMNELNLQEVLDIKNRFAKHKIPIQINSLLSGIMVPTYKEDINNKLMDIGQSMLQNPFEEKKGKKKKKKKE